MTQPVQDKIWLTQEAYDKLKAELENLRGPVRHEIIDRISNARDEGDLKENGGYHAAKDEQGKVEARIRQIEEMLRRASVGETPQDNGIVEPGMKVTYKFVGDDDTSTFLLGNKALEDGTIDVFSPESPLGAAILGAKVGDQVSYTAPTGKTLQVEVVEAKPYAAG
jgi:transcription elongation factor GreA